MEKIKKLVFGLIFLFVGLQSFAQASIDELLKKYNTGEIPYVSVEELRMKQLNGNVVILDSRTAEEFKVSHLEGAIFIGVGKEKTQQLESLSREKPIVVYCSLGVRSEEAALWLRDLGFTNVSNLYGGIFKWKNEDFPVVDPEGKPTEKVHAYSKHWSRWLHNAEKVY